MEIITRLLQFFTGAPAGEQMQSGIDIWNAIIESVFVLLGISPVDFEGGVVWAYIEQIYSYMSIIAGSLLSVVMLYHMCKETIDIRQEMRPDTVIKMFCIFIISEAVVLNAMTIMKAMFRIAGGCITLLHVGYEPLTASVVLQDTNLGMIEGIVALLVCLAFYILSSLMTYTVYFRFFKIFLIASFSSVACAFLAGGQEVSRIGFSYLKTLAAYTFEIVIIALAINIGNRLGSMGSSIGVDNIIWQMLCPVLNVGLIVGASKGAEGILRKTFAL